MAEGFFNVEDFVQSILSQLDRVQDALRLKAVNRPLTYALKDISLDFHVFAELDAEGNVRFRPAASNEAGASTLKLGFTTITRPMIEENTVSLAATRSPRIDELGLAPDEVKRLEGVGVRTAAQLNRLQSVAGASTVSRWANVDATRLRDVMQRARPSVDRVNVQPPRPAPVKPAPVKPAPPPVRPPFVPPAVQPPIDLGPRQPSPIAQPAIPGKPSPGRLVRIGGRNLLGSDTPVARFNDRPVSIARAADDELELELPEDASQGTLELRFGDDVQSFELDLPPLEGAVSAQEDHPDAHANGRAWDGDPWLPRGAR
jgi:hypothetical protein